ncbi:MAG: DUF2333 family protein [Gammaproteobacteria bacterium]
MKAFLYGLGSRLAAAPLRLRIVAGIIGAFLLLNLVLFIWWNNEPELFDVRGDALARVDGDVNRLWPGVVTTNTLIRTVDTLLGKAGGYLSNDVMPPGVMMDNIPNWEFGVVSQIRDLAKALRNDMSRSRTQSTEDPALQIAEPHFNYQNDAWILPSTESEYRAGRNQLERYLTRLLDPANQNTQFYARADNLDDYLELVELRLGSLSQRLSASIAQERVNVDIDGSVRAESTTDERASISVKTPWMEIDDVFYEARGSAWALILFLRAVEIDFMPVLRDKNAEALLRQAIRELEGTQAYVWSPMILNGTGFGFVANHSLVMASYLSRANAAVRDLRQLLEQG